MRFYTTSVGKKIVMAISGFIVFGFVVIHLVGNLQIFFGPETLNRYAEMLQGLGGALWLFRALLLLSIVLHIVAATQVTLQSWQARPKGYAVTRYRTTSYAARTMRWGGPLIALFVVYHILHLTTGGLHPRPAGFISQAGGTINVYNNVVYGFQIWWTSALYIIAILALCLHLYHGVSSMMQSVGLNHPRWNQWRRFAAVFFSLFVAAAGVSIPLAVLLGLVQPV
ncbi:MAG: succinate dehydrogenase cytochrome b subunit [Deltaproteobacteria bacterium]|nr:succinate dehydrogenase cytochrome b subunit [Deltaproteobacteria bacterium]